MTKAEDVYSKPPREAGKPQRRAGPDVRADLPLPELLRERERIQSRLQEIQRMIMADKTAASSKLETALIGAASDCRLLFSAWLDAAPKAKPAANARFDRMRRKIAKIPATTPAAWHAKATIAVLEIDDEDDAAVAVSLSRDLAYGDMRGVKPTAAVRLAARPALEAEG